MIKLENTLISDDIIEEEFACNLSACKGSCCVEGVSGAPLESSELDILNQIKDKIQPYISEKAKESIKKNGMYVKAKDGSWETPLVEGKECAFALFEDNGVVKCSIEKAFNEKKISWQKPISCHLYPVRLKKIGDKIALNYDQWQICSSACKNGKKLKIPIYEFTEKALKRKFGKSWFEKLKLIAKKHQKS